MSKYVKGDFGGVSYKQGDFHTEGTSGFGTIGGNTLTSWLSNILGQENASSVVDAAQKAASSALINVAGKSTTNPKAKEAIAETAKSTIAQIYQEYKTPILVVGGSIALLAGLGLYNTFKKR